MRIGCKCLRLFGLVAIVLALVLLGLIIAGCRNGGTSSTAATTAVAGSTTVSLDTTTSVVSTTAASAPATSETTSGTLPSTTTTAATTTTTVQTTTTTAKVTTTTVKATTTTAKVTTTTVKGPVILHVTGPSGTKDLTMAQLKAMPASSGYGGWKNQLGNITGPVSWKGVSLRALMDLVGGGSSASVTASDNYARTISASELSGAVAVYDPATGQDIDNYSGSIRVIVAYSENGAALPSGEGPLRIAFVSSTKDEVTDGSSWVKLVAAIKAK